ncbi:MAG: hypothetical protein ACYDC4_13575 [Candidatus Dormibacteria bacterium]
MESIRAVPHAGGRALVNDVVQFFNDAGDAGLNGANCPAIPPAAGSPRLMPEAMA